MTFSRYLLTRGAASVVLAGSLVLAASGCSKRTDTTTTDTTAMMSDTNHATTAPTATDTSSHATGGADVTSMNLTDANIFALLDEADSGEVAEAKAVLAKAKNADVRGFANMMIADHSRLKKEGDALAKKLNITPQPPANDPKPGKLTTMLSQINSASDEHTLDTLYINQAVEDHQEDVKDLQAFQSKAQNAELKAAIGKALPVVQKHLDRAKAIQSKMSSSTAAAADTMHGKTMQKKK